MAVESSEKRDSGLRGLILLHDGIVGHYNQSLGVAEWLGELGGISGCEPGRFPIWTKKPGFWSIKSGHGGFEILEEPPGAPGS